MVQTAETFCATDMTEYERKQARTDPGCWAAIAACAPSEKVPCVPSIDTLKIVKLKKTREKLEKNYYFLIIEKSFFYVDFSDLTRGGGVAVQIHTG